MDSELQESGFLRLVHVILVDIRVVICPHIAVIRLSLVVPPTAHVI
jgi:hypothetical protein